MSKVFKPVTCGHGIDVPKAILNWVRRGSDDSSVGATPFGQAAKILTLGAITSGLRTKIDSALGPLEEKDATTGADFYSNLSFIESHRGCWIVVGVNVIANEVTD